MIIKISGWVIVLLIGLLTGGVICNSKVHGAVRLIVSLFNIGVIFWILFQPTMRF